MVNGSHTGSPRLLKQIGVEGIAVGDPINGRESALAIGAVYVAGAQNTPLQVTELAEQEQGMAAGAARVPVLG